jgi:serine/threonine protein kinase
VLDFGISKSTGKGEDVSLTRTSTVMGSPLYMSPEQMTSAKMADQRSDIWALGVILYELVTGVSPFVAETMTEVIANILMNQPAPSSVSVAPELMAVIKRCIEKGPANRYQNVAELAAALTPLGPLSQQGSAERVTRVLGATINLPPQRPRLESTPGDTASAPEIAAKPLVAETNASWGKTGGETAANPPGKSKNTTLIVVAALLVVGIGSAIALSVSRSPTPPPPPVAATQEPAPPPPVATPSIAPPSTSAPAPSIAVSAAPLPVATPPAPVPATAVAKPVRPTPVLVPSATASAPPAKPAEKSPLQIDLK